jgi:hypothetical protein
MHLDADGADMHHGFRVILDVIIDAQVSDAQLPGGKGIRSQGLAVASLHRRLMDQLLLDGIHHDHAP